MGGGGQAGKRGAGSNSQVLTSFSHHHKTLRYIIILTTEMCAERETGGQAETERGEMFV